MDLQNFIFRIKKTLILDEAHRQRFITNAKDYSSGLRTKLIGILDKYEKEYIKYGEQYLIEIQKQASQNFYIMTEQHEIIHKKELEEAEIQLEKDICSL